MVSRENSVRNPEYSAQDSIMIFIVRKAEIAKRTNSFLLSTACRVSSGAAALYPNLAMVWIICGVFFFLL